MGRQVRAQEIPVEEWSVSARAAGLDEPRIDTLTRMFRYYGSHGLAGGSTVLEWLLGRSATRFGDFVARQVDPEGLSGP